MYKIREDHEGRGGAMVRVDRKFDACVCER